MITPQAKAYILLHPYTSLNKLTARNRDPKVKLMVERYHRSLQSDLETLYGLTVEAVPQYAGELIGLIQSSLIMQTRSKEPRGVHLMIGAEQFELSKEDILTLTEHLEAKQIKRFHNFIWRVGKQLAMLEPLLFTKLSLEYVDKLYRLLDYRRREHHIKLLDELVFNPTTFTFEDESVDTLISFIKDYYRD